jgi:hypothetical protein
MGSISDKAVVKASPISGEEKKKMMAAPGKK